MPTENREWEIWGILTLRPKCSRLLDLEDSWELLNRHLLVLSTNIQLLVLKNHLPLSQERCTQETQLLGNQVEAMGRIH